MAFVKLTESEKGVSWVCFDAMIVQTPTQTRYIRHVPETDSWELMKSSGSSPIWVPVNAKSKYLEKLKQLYIEYIFEKELLNPDLI